MSERLEEIDDSNKSKEKKSKKKKYRDHFDRELDCEKHHYDFKYYDKRSRSAVYACVNCGKKIFT